MVVTAGKENWVWEHLRMMLLSVRTRGQLMVTSLVVRVLVDGAAVAESVDWVVL